MRREKMKCEELNINMFDLIEGKLDRTTIKAFKAHIEICDNCKSVYGFIEEAIEQLDTEKEVKVSDGFSDRLIERVQEVNRHGYSIALFLKPLAAAAVVIFGVFTGIFISELMHANNTDLYADLPDEFYYTNEIHLETIETFFLINED